MSKASINLDHDCTTLWDLSSHFSSKASYRAERLELRNLECIWSLTFSIHMHKSIASQDTVWSILKLSQAPLLHRTAQTWQFWAKTPHLHFHSCILFLNQPKTLDTSYTGDPRPCFKTVTPPSLSIIFKTEACNLTWVESSSHPQSKVGVGIHSRRSRPTAEIIRPS